MRLSQASVLCALLFLTAITIASTDIAQTIIEDINIVKDDAVAVGKGVVDGVEKLLRGCECVKPACGCCDYLEEERIHLNSTICVNVTYLSEDYGISVTSTINQYTIFNETVSARNPPPICVGAPYVKELANLCLRFHDLNATRVYLHGCVRAEARMKSVLIAHYELGCFNIGKTSEKYWEAGEENQTVKKNNFEPKVYLV